MGEQSDQGMKKGMSRFFTTMLWLANPSHLRPNGKHSVVECPGTWKFLEGRGSRQISAQGETRYVIFDGDKIDQVQSG